MNNAKDAVNMMKKAHQFFSKYFDQNGNPIHSGTTFDTEILKLLDDMWYLQHSSQNAADELYLKENCDKIDGEGKTDDGEAFVLAKGNPDINIPMLPSLQNTSVENTCDETGDAIGEVEIVSSWPTNSFFHGYFAYMYFGPFANNICLLLFIVNVFNNADATCIRIITF